MSFPRKRKKATVLSSSSDSDDDDSISLAQPIKLVATLPHCEPEELAAAPDRGCEPVAMDDDAAAAREVHLALNGSSRRCCLKSERNATMNEPARAEQQVEVLQKMTIPSAQLQQPNTCVEWWEQGQQVETFSQEDWWQCNVLETRQAADHTELLVEYIGGIEEDNEWVAMNSGKVRAPCSSRASPDEPKQSEENTAETSEEISEETAEDITDEITDEITVDTIEEQKEVNQRAMQAGAPLRVQRAPVCLGLTVPKLQARFKPPWQHRPTDLGLVPSSRRVGRSLGNRRSNALGVHALNNSATADEGASAIPDSEKPEVNLRVSRKGTLGRRKPKMIGYFPTKSPVKPSIPEPEVSPHNFHADQKIRLTLRSGDS